MLPPTAVTADSLTATAGWATTARPATAVHRDFAQFATSPLWWMLASLATQMVGVLVWVIAVVGVTASEGNDGQVSDGAIAGLGVGLVVTVLLLFAGWVLSMIWMFTIGQNAGTFGLGLMLVTLFPIYLAPLLFGGPTLLTLGVIVWACWPYRLLQTGIWTAGLLPRGWAVLGWAPMAAGWCFILGAWLSLSSAAEANWTDGATVGTAAVLWVIGQLLIGVSSAFASGSAIAVTIIQHVGIGRDRRRREEARQADRAARAFG